MTTVQESSAVQEDFALLPVSRSTAVVRVNLLPPEIRAARRLRHVQAGIAAAGVVSVLAVGALHAQQAGARDAAQRDLTSSQRDAATLRSEQASLADVDTLYAQADAAQAMLQTATGQRVDWSALMDGISQAVPAHDWITTLTMTAGTTATAGSVASPATAAAAGAGGVGSVTVNGQGFTHGDAASWLEKLGRVDGVSEPYLTSSVESLVGPAGKQVPVVSWTTTATITAGALAPSVEVGK